MNMQIALANQMLDHLPNATLVACCQVNVSKFEVAATGDSSIDLDSIVKGDVVEIIMNKS